MKTIFANGAWKYRLAELPCIGALMWITGPWLWWWYLAIPACMAVLCIIAREELRHELGRA